MEKITKKVNALVHTSEAKVDNVPTFLSSPDDSLTKVLAQFIQEEKVPAIEHRGYRTATADEESDLSDEEGSKMPDAMPFAEGGYDGARSLRPKRRHRRASLEREPVAKTLVFSPLGHYRGNTDGEFDATYVEQVQKKYDFHNALYPQRPAKLYLIKGEDPKEPKTFGKLISYRYVRDSFPGTTYDKVEICNALMAIDLFISATKALHHAHQRGYVVVDIKLDNIFYDASDKQSYFSDGGMAYHPGTPTEEQFHLSAGEAMKLPAMKKVYWQYAPEYWTVGSQERALFQPEGDVFALGAVFKGLLSRTALSYNVALRQLIDSCVEEKPENRKSLNQLLAQLENLRHEVLESLHAQLKRSQLPDDQLTKEQLERRELDTLTGNLFALAANESAALEEVGYVEPVVVGNGMRM